MSTLWRRIAVGITAAALALTGCTAAPAKDAASSKTVTVVTHESFQLSPEVLKKFTAQTGYEVTITKISDAGAMTNQLVLTKNAPLGDVVFGIDNTFAGRAIKEQVVQPYTSAKLPASAAALKADDSNRLTPIDFGDVCINADKNWFAAKNLPLPKTLDDVAKPQYKGLLVVEHPASSSPGLAFLAATVAAKGENGYLAYWDQLKANDVKIVRGWTEAYNIEYSAGEGKGSRPLVVSYATSPAFHLNAAGTESSTVSLPETCFRQIEYAGVITGAANQEGAQAFIDFLLSPEVQADIPNQMYMYPVVKTTKLPEAWVKVAPLADKPWTLSTATLGTQREAWITAWTARVIG